MKITINPITFDSSEKISSKMQQFQTLGFHCLNIKISRIMKYSCDQNLLEYLQQKNLTECGRTF